MDKHLLYGDLLDLQYYLMILQAEFEANKPGFFLRHGLSAVDLEKVQDLIKLVGAKAQEEYENA